MEALLALIGQFVLVSFGVSVVVGGEGVFAIFAILVEGLIALVQILISLLLSFIPSDGSKRPVENAESGGASARAGNSKPSATAEPDQSESSSNEPHSPSSVVITSPARRTSRTVFFWVKWGSFGVFVALVSTLVVVNMFFFEQVTRWALASAEERTGTRITFSSASGNFFTGRVDLHDVRLVRFTGEKPGFDIVAARVAINLDIPGILQSPSLVESVEISGVSGKIEHRPRPKAKGRGSIRAAIGRFGRENPSSLNGCD